MQNWLTSNFWLKMVSLLLAIVAWMYISGELAKRPGNYYPRSQVVPNQ